MNVIGVSLVDTLNTPLNFTRPGNIVRIELDRAYVSEEVIRVMIDYNGLPQHSFGFNTYQGEPMIWTLSEPFGARAWWMPDMQRMEAAMAEGPRSYASEVPPGMEEATDLVVDMLGSMQDELEVPNERLIVGGFSQGSMAACNAVFTRGVAPAGLVILSGTPVNLSAWKEGMRKRRSLRVLQSHGARDPLLSFEAAEELRDALRDEGLQTDWVPFHGGHEIPTTVLDALAKFIRGLA